MRYSDTAGARKCRAYRARRRSGVVVVPVEIGAEMQNALRAANLIDSDAPLDRAAIADGIRILLGCLMLGRLTFK